MNPVRRLAMIPLLCVGLLLAGCAGSGMSTAERAVEPSSQAALSSAKTQRARAHIELGTAYFQAGNMAVALEEVRIALSADRSYAPAYNLSGLIHMYLRENPVAEENFREGLRLAPGDPEISNNYGWFLCQTGREADGIAQFVSAVKNPLYATPELSLTNAGICAMQLGDLAAAEDYLIKALRLGRNTGGALLQLGHLNYRQKRYVDARDYLAKLHAQVEPTAESLWLAIRVERAAGDRRAEAGFISQLRRRFPDSKEARESRQGVGG
ncbi:MAG TPA: type IV pilus biogenesis/stability protein PilW [Rhodocyclaceae bacterium]